MGLFPLSLQSSDRNMFISNKYSTVWSPRFRKGGGNEITENQKEWAFWFCRWKGCFGKKHGARMGF